MQVVNSTEDPCTAVVMNILVCVKQVPQIESIVVRESFEGAAILEAPDEFGMNRFDEFAVEQAVQFKSSNPPIHIHALTVGPGRAAEVLKRAIGMGCDDGVHLRTESDADPGPARVAVWIAEYAQTGHYGLILCGSMSEDGMHGQVGPMVAAHLGWSYATQVIVARFQDGSSGLAIEREVEGGVRERVAMGCPALLALQPGINRPRYPSLSNLLRANRQAMENISVDTLACPVDHPACVGLTVPRRRRASRLIKGTAFEKAEKVIDLLRARALV